MADAMPDRDTVDAIVLYDTAITLLAKADIYPDHIVGQVVTWLRRCDDEDYARVCELASLLERIRDGQATDYVAKLARVAAVARSVIATEDVGGECYEPFLRSLEQALKALEPIATAPAEDEARDRAIMQVLTVLRNPLMLISADRKEALQLAEQFTISAADLIACARKMAKTA